MASVSGRGRAVDACQCDARVCDHDVIGVGDDPGRGGIAAAVLAGVAAQPLIEHGLAALELLAVVAALASRSAGRCSSVKPAGLALAAQRLGEAFVDLCGSLQCLGERG